MQCLMKLHYDSNKNNVNISSDWSSTGSKLKQPRGHHNLDDSVKYKYYWMAALFLILDFPSENKEGPKRGRVWVGINLISQPNFT